MNANKLILSTAACLAIAGCDKIAECLPSHRERRAIENAVEQVSRPEADSASESMDSASLQAFRHHVEATSGMLAGELSAAAGRVGEIHADSDALAKAMSAATGRRKEDGGPIGRKEALLSLLRDDSVNALARRYLHRDFSMVALEAEERINAAEASELRRRGQLDANAAEAQSAVEAAREEGRRARAAALKSERKLKQDLDGLRRRRNRLEHELNMISAAERPRKSQDLRHIDDEIRRMEREYDGLRASSAVNSEINRSSERVRQAQAAADARRIRADAEVRKAGERAVSPSDVAVEFERDTVVALEKAIWDALASAEARKVRISRALDYVKSMGDVRNSLAPSVLNRMRAEIDARVSAALEEPKQSR